MTASTHKKIETSEGVASVESVEDATHIKRETPLNVYQRMVVAQGVIERTVFEKSQKSGAKTLKDGKQPDDGFNSVPIDAMRSAVRRACIEAGLVHVGFLGLDYKLDARTSKFGGTLYHYEGTATFRYVNADDPSDYIDFYSAGEANDSGDKSFGKMLTNIIKNHYKQAWDIGEHGKDDVDSYSNEEVEDEADRIAERRAKRAEAVRNDPFYSKEPSADVIALRKQIGQAFSKGGEVAGIVDRYKAEHGSFSTWDEGTLRACLDEVSKEGGQ